MKSNQKWLKVCLIALVLLLRINMHIYNLRVLKRFNMLFKVVKNSKNVLLKSHLILEKQK
ncbi:hypothetical protein T10_2896 [Trichinella papuae]|uniref:Uncharacterized protein n=1 Tax=Trichinella papuae TaxID=268474 RepID=A0A0V1MDG3_9BILA|nr:hypothetical protein T10_2896 [Trichinella papuae]